MATDLTLRCKCGTVQGRLRDVGPGAGCHLVCYCVDCRAAAHHLDKAAQLEPGGGVALYQTTPARVEIVAGADHIACLRLSPKGLLRWYASCCDTPLANTTGSPKMPFVGLVRAVIADPAALGPVQAHGFTKFAIPGRGAPKKDRGLAVMAWGMLRRTAAAYLGGTVYPNPFFTPDRRPIAPPVVLSQAQRKAANSNV